jgi:outer membrane protein OmpA-like peptidoglycan-associated protein
MKSYRAYLLGGACLGLLSLSAAAKEGQTPPAAKVETGVLMVAENEPAPATEAAPAPAAEAPAADAAPAAAAEEAPPMTPPGVTEYYGETKPASEAPFSAEATMNPDYTAAPAAASQAPAAEPASDAAAPAPAAEAAPAAAEEAPPMTPPGVTEYYGETKPASEAPFSAEATMNPDYTAAPAAASETPAEAAPAPAAAAAEEAPPPMTPPGQTEYYGDTSPKTPPAWAAEATMNPDTGGAAASPATQQAVEACRDALNAEAQTGTILFASSKWDVLPGSFKTLDKIAKIAKDCTADFVIEVGGHTDNIGKPPSNKTISELRAKSVINYLTKAGVDAAKLKAVGYGQDKPVGNNATLEGRRQNRRIEFLVTAN